MDQPRPRHITLKSPLIERPDLQSPQQRTVYGVLTLVFWFAPEFTARTAPEPAVTFRPGCVPLIDPVTISVALSDQVPTVASAALN